MGRRARLCLGPLASDGSPEPTNGSATMEGLHCFTFVFLIVVNPSSFPTKGHNSTNGLTLRERRLFVALQEAQRGQHLLLQEPPFAERCASRNANEVSFVRADVDLT